MSSTPSFKTHPNATVVVNFFVIRGGRKFHNKNAFRAKYSSVENAEWMRDTMQRLHATRTWYLIAA